MWHNFDDGPAKVFAISGVSIVSDVDGELVLKLDDPAYKTYLLLILRVQQVCLMHVAIVTDLEKWAHIRCSRDCKLYLNDQPADMLGLPLEMTLSKADRDLISGAIALPRNNSEGYQIAIIAFTLGNLPLHTLSTMTGLR